MNVQKGNVEDIVIPELEKAAEEYTPVMKRWSETEDSILLKYYGKVPKELLLKHLQGRTWKACMGRIHILRAR